MGFSAVAERPKTLNNKDSAAEFDGPAAVLTLLCESRGSRLEWLRGTQD